MSSTIESATALIKQFLPADNPYFSAGFGLAGLGMGVAVLKRGMNVATILARRHFLVTMEVTSKDIAYPWVLKWLTAQGRRTQHITVGTKVSSKPNGTVDTSFDFLPSPGQHLTMYRGRLLWIQRVREQQMMDLNSGEPYETVTFTTIGSSLKVFETFLEEAAQDARGSEEGRTTIYTCWGTDWRRFGHPRRKKPLQSVVLESGVAEGIVRDLQEFSKSGAWYADRGIPYRRGYLLHGTPGSGKSSFIMALAGELGANICILNLNEAGMTDDRLAHALSAVPQHSIVLLEDVDAAFQHREDRSAARVTFSGLLNVLDGLVSSEERIVFMTTNHIERLDPALIRPGRVDVVHYFGPATPDQIERLFAKFYPSESEKGKAFVTLLHGAVLSMAGLQGYFLRYKDNPEAALANAQTLLHGDAASQRVPGRGLAAAFAGGGPVPVVKVKREQMTITSNSG